MAYNTIIFDMDGTVLNTLTDITNAVNYMLAQEGLPPVCEEQVRARVGNGVQVLMEKSLPGGTEYPRFAEASACYRAYYEAHSEDNTAPYPGILDLMEALRQRGVTMAVVSNKQHAAVAPLSRQYFGDYMTLALGEAPSLRRKPYPDMVWAAMKELGKQAEECVYVGDSEVDFATAQNSGLDCVSVTWGYRTRELLESLRPMAIIDHPSELLNYV